MVGVAVPFAGQPGASSPEGAGLDARPPCLGRRVEQRAHDFPPRWAVIAQTFSPVLISSVRSNEGKKTVHVAAVERIDCTPPGSGRGVLKLRRPPIELLQPRERDIEGCLVEDFAA